MGSYDAFYTALSGMTANSTAISVVGDNLANVNTVGFKASRASFQDVLGHTLLGAMGSRRMGQGVSLQSIDQMHTQGGLETTGRVTDLAIAGNGFFIVRDADGSAGEAFYTRAGQFGLDQHGFVVSPAGMRLQGYTAAADGTMGTSLGDIDLGGITSPATATSEVDLQVNLPATEAEGETTFETTLTVYDSLGRTHDVTVTFERDATDPMKWNWTAGNADGEFGSGSVTFDANGQLATGSPASFDFVPGGGADSPQPIALDFGTAGESGASTNLGSDWNTIDVEQNGHGAGLLETITIGEDGVVQGTFDNGRTRDIAQVALASFDNVGGLERAGGSLWARTPDSGEALVGAAGSGGRGALLSGNLETSNVDMTREFVNLITAQRGFQAASRTITTVDQLLSEAIALKR